MQFYLDKKFINKVILSSLNSNEKFQTKICLELIEYIKEYFQLYDIIIMQPTNLEKIRDKNSFRDQVKTLINNKYEGMELKPRKDNIIIETIKIIQNNFTYIFIQVVMKIIIEILLFAPQRSPIISIKMILLL